MRGIAGSAAALALGWAMPAVAQTNVAGRWIATVDYFGTPIYWTLELEQDGVALRGSLTGDVLEGNVQGDTIRFFAKDTVGGSEDVVARLRGGKIRGEMVLIDGAGPDHSPHTLRFTAERLPQPSNAPPRVHRFTPERFYRQFSPFNPPALHVNPGDTIETQTIDAAGIDAQGIRRAHGGNPQTGPFYIDGAMPGDTLVVRIRTLRLNRDTAVSTNGMSERGQDARTAVQMAGTGQPVTWHLDRVMSLATPAPGSGDVGSFGGNMDFNEMGEGTIVYLPVAVPGALLYFGDAHAAQGDGEMTGDALETSMDVSVQVDLIRAKSVNYVRIETPMHLVTIGMEGSLDGSFRSATSNMFGWLTADYRLAPADIAQVIGTAAEYRVSAVPGRAAGMVLKIPKERLAPLKQ